MEAKERLVNQIKEDMKTGKFWIYIFLFIAVSFAMMYLYTYFNGFNTTAIEVFIWMLSGCISLYIAMILRYR